MGYELGTYTWESIPIDLHLVWASAEHFHGVLKRPRPSVVTRETSMPLPPTEGAILQTHSKEVLMQIEEPKGSTIRAECPFPRAKRTRGRKGVDGKTLRPSTPKVLQKV